jgi:hypothetical protein
VRTIRPVLAALFVLGAALAIAPVGSSAGTPPLVVRELSGQAHVKATVTFTTARCQRGASGAQIAYLLTAKVTFGPRGAVQLGDGYIANQDFSGSVAAVGTLHCPVPRPRKGR